MHRRSIEKNSCLLSHMLMFLHSSWTALQSCASFVGDLVCYQWLFVVVPRGSQFDSYPAILRARDQNRYVVWCQPLVVCARCLGALSCINVICRLCWFTNGISAGWSASATYLLEVTYPLNLRISLDPSALIAAHIIMLRLGPKWWIFCWWKRSFFFLLTPQHTYNLRSLIFR